MAGVEVYFGDESELAEWEAGQKGFRSDVYVRATGHLYKVAVYGIGRLHQSFDSGFETSGFYQMEPNMVLVSDAGKAEIVETLNQLHLRGFFAKLGPLPDGASTEGMVRVQ